MILKQISVLLFFSFLSLHTLAQNNLTKGTDFWLGFQENSTLPVLEVSITSSRNTNGTITIPLSSWEQDFTVAAGLVTQVELPLLQAMAIESETVESKGIHIVASDTVSVVAFNRANKSTDATTILPTHSLGNEYYVFSYQRGTYEPLSEFLIVATEDNTIVEITPAEQTLGGQPANVPFQTTLDAGEVYQVKTDQQSLTGSRVFGDKPLAVFGGNECAIIPEGAWCDHLFAQMQPLSIWGTQFITMPLATRLNGDTYMIMASADNSSVEINGGVAFTLDAGEYMEQIIVDPSLIVSDQPICVVHYSNSQTYDNVWDSDPFMTIVSPLEQVVNRSIFKTYTINSINANYVNLLCETSTIAQVEWNGMPVDPGFFEAIPSTLYSYATLLIEEEGSHMLESEAGFIAYAYGYGNAESYGYTLGDIKLFDGVINALNTATAKNIRLFPNPIEQQSVLTFDNPGNKMHQMKIFDIDGKSVRQYSKLKGGSIIIRKEGLLPGLYFFQLSGEGKSMSSGRFMIR